MENLWEAYKSGVWVEPFLVYSIAVFMAVGAMLFMFIIVIRSEKIERRKRHNDYEPIIENIFMSVVFEGRLYASIKQDPQYEKFIHLKTFRKQMLKSLRNLHQNYEGIYARKLEDFYFDSGLIKTSFSKLKSKNWQVVCTGIQELSEMKVSKAFPALIKLSHTRNKEVKITAIKACAKLNAGKGLVHLADHKDPIDLWEQVNIVSAFKRNYIEDDDAIELLLASGNTTVVSLGLKIIHTLELARKAPFVLSLIEHSPNDMIRLEAQDVLHFLNTQTKNGNDGF